MLPAKASTAVNVLNRWILCECYTDERTKSITLLLAMKKRFLRIFCMCVCTASHKFSGHFNFITDKARTGAHNASP